MTSNSRHRAVIFDMGGVILPSPIPFFEAYTRRNNIDNGTLFKLMFSHETETPWQKLECGKLDIKEFEVEYAALCQQVLGRHLDPLFRGMLSGYSKHGSECPEMIDAIKCLKAEGFLVGLLTNNFFVTKEESFCPLDHSLFDVVIESCRVGTRKPMPDIYHLILDKLGVKPEEAIFLDDFESNLKPAKELGIHTIHVDNQLRALRELEELLGMKLQGYIPRTIHVKPECALPTKSLTSYLKKVVGSSTEDDSLVLRQFQRGHLNPTYYINFGGRELVLRMKPRGKQLPWAHSLEYEFRLMKCLEKADIPVPHCVHFCEDESVLGTPFYIMDYIKGRSFSDPALPALEKEEREKIYKAMSEVLTKIHSLDVGKINLEDVSLRNANVARQIEELRAHYEERKLEGALSVTKIVEWLTKRIPEQDITTLIHGDFRMENLIFHEKRPEVIAVLGWDYSSLGDPWTDLALNCLAYRLDSKTTRLKGLGEADLLSLGIPTESEYIQEYCNKQGISQTMNWKFYTAFTLFRMELMARLFSWTLAPGGPLLNNDLLLNVC